MTEAGTRVREVPAAATFALRHRVLRPHLSAAEMALAGDFDSTTVHLAVLAADGDVLSTLRLQPAACPWFPASRPAWQLRGMATDTSRRGEGLGGELVAAAVRHVAPRGGGLLWCNARVRAEAFYARAGFVATDVRWEEPVIGPHVGMVREVPAA